MVNAVVGYIPSRREIIILFPTCNTLKRRKVSGLECLNTMLFVYSAIRGTEEEVIKKIPKQNKKSEY